MASLNFNTELAWRSQFDGREQYAEVPFPPGSMLQGWTLTLMVLCEHTPFTQADRDHALRRNQETYGKRPLTRFAVSACS
jgi:hypothetical protein